MNDFYYPITGDSIANVTDMASRTGGLTRGGLDSLRGLGLKNLDNVEAAAAESPLMSRLGDKVKNIQTQTNDASAIMETIPKNEIPGKTASAREFLLNALKDENVNRTVFRDVVSPQDLKAITEGGGGVELDPIVLVQKYFGPRVAELLPSNATVDDIAIFSQRILNNATDAKGLRPTDPGFDKLTLKIEESIKPNPDGLPFADGGRARVGFAGGGKDAGAGSNFGSENFGGDGDSNRENYRTKQYTTPKTINNNNNNNTTPTDVGNPFGYGNPPPTNVGNPFGYNNIKTAVLSNRYNTDLEDDVPSTYNGSLQPTINFFDKFNKHDKFTDQVKLTTGTPNYHQLGGFDFMARFPDINPSIAKSLGTGYQYITEGARALKNNTSFSDAFSKAKEEARLNSIGIDDFANPESATYKQYQELVPESGKVVFADGGIAGLDTRQGLRIGGKAFKTILSKINDKMIKKAADDIFPTNDYKYDAELVVDALVENNPKLFKNLLADDLDDVLRSELYGLAVSETGTRAAMRIKAGRMERPLFDENGKLNKDAVLADASKYDGLDGKKASDVIKQGEEITSKNFGNSQFAPRSFKLNVERAISELNIPREEAERIARLSSDEQKAALQIYMDRSTAQGVQLMNYNPKKFDAAKGGLAKILEL